MFYQEAQPYLFQVSDSQECKHPEKPLLQPKYAGALFALRFWPPSPEHRTAMLVLESNLCPPAWAVSSGRDPPPPLRVVCA